MKHTPFLLNLSIALSLSGLFTGLPAAAQAVSPPASSAINSPFVVKPYLQIGRQPGPTHLQLMWHTADESAAWSAQVRLTPKQEWVNMDAPQSTRVAVAGVAPRWLLNSALGNLEPGKRFEYRLMRNGQPVFQSEAQAPKAANQSYRFVAFGDVGAGTPEQKQILEAHYFKKMNRNEKAKYTAKKEAQAEAEKIKAELAVAAAAAAEKKTKVLEENRKRDIREASEEKKLARALKPYRGKRI